MSDFLFIEGLKIDCLIGLAEWERMVRQQVVLDLELEGDLRTPAKTDQVGPEGLNTKAVSKRLQAFVGETEFGLLETLAEKVCELLLSEFPITRVRLRLSKPGALRGADKVGVRLERKPEDYPW